MKSEITFLKRGLYRIAGRPLPVPHFAQIEITNICNLTCEKCVRNHIKGLKFEHIAYDKFINIVDRLAGVHTIGLTGFGEPLTYPKIFDAIRYCKERGFEVQFTSNGLLLSDEKIKKLIESDIDIVSFSVDSIADDHPLHQNAKALPKIERLIQARDELGRRNPKVAIQSVMVKGHESNMEEVIRWAGKRDVFRMNISRLNLNTSTHSERLSWQDEKELFKKFEDYRKKIWHSD